MFPSPDAYLDIMKQAPYIQPWSPAIETYYRYELEKADGGVRVNIRPEHIQEEAQNMRMVATDSFYPLITCKTLILRATNGLLSQDALLLPEPVVARMLEEIPKGRRIDIVGTNHYGIVFQPNELRDRAIQSFLDEP